MTNPHGSYSDLRDSLQQSGFTIESWNNNELHLNGPSTSQNQIDQVLNKYPNAFTGTVYFNGQQYTPSGTSKTMQSSGGSSSS